MTLVEQKLRMVVSNSILVSCVDQIVREHTLTQFQQRQGRHSALMCIT